MNEEITKLRKASKLNFVFGILDIVCAFVGLIFHLPFAWNCIMLGLGLWSLFVSNRTKTLANEIEQTELLLAEFAKKLKEGTKND